MVSSLGLVCYAAFRALRLEPDLDAGRYSTDSRFWKAELFYFNPEDSAIMVPKREGFGHTLNFGRPISWLILAAVIVLPLLLPLLLHVTSHP